MANVASSINLLRFDTMLSTHSVRFYPPLHCLQQLFFGHVSGLTAVFWTKNLTINFVLMRYLNVTSNGRRGANLHSNIFRAERELSLPAP